MLQAVPTFGSPIVAAFGVICVWVLLFLPFGIWARLIVRNDSLSGFEAYILGQMGGPLGVYAVMRANRKAADRQYKAELLAETMKTHEVQAGLPPEEIEKQNKELGRPGMLESPGGRAWRPPPKEGLTPAKQRRELDSVGQETQLRPQENTSPEKVPNEPSEAPPIKAADAFRPPPKDYKFTHSDEQPEGVDDADDGDAKSQ